MRTKLSRNFSAVLIAVPRTLYAGPFARIITPPDVEWTRVRTLFTGEFATALTSARTILLVVSLPLWAVFAVSFGSPLLAFLGVLLAQVIGRKGAKELEIRSKREETLRTMRWAAELSASKEDRLADLGVAELEALLGSDLLEESEKTFVEAALTAVYVDPEEQLDELGAEGETVEVFVADASAILQLASDSDVSLGGDSDDGEERDG